MAQQNYLQSGLDLTKVNPAELEPESLEKYRQTIQEQIKALEERYKEPNWFKVAAGFAKPQLGGFFASLGSAAEALGENVEKEREQMLPLAQMKIAVEQANMIVGQKQKQNQIFQEWRASGRPMDEQTYTRIASLGDTEVSRAAKQFWEQAQARVGAGITAEEAATRFPRIDQSLQDYIDAALNPKADSKQVSDKSKQYEASLNAAKPPQIDQAQWNAMSRYDKSEASAQYARAQREAGMGEEKAFQQQAQQAPSRLTLLSSIRDLALGVGLKDAQKMVDGKPTTVSGQQQMAELLNKFGGNNPFEVLARAAADGKFGETLRELDVYARQAQMSPEAKDQFQKLVKLLAENQISLRNSAVNPTDAAAMLQAAGSPGIGNSQTALVALVDLMGHSEQNAIEKYKYILDNRVPYRMLGVDPGYLEKQAQYAAEHRKIATSNPLVNMPSWYNPARSNKAQKAEESAPVTPSAAPSAPSATPSAKPSAPKERSNRMKGANGNEWVRVGNKWEDTGKPFK
jgi:ribosomal protein L7/L12